jgi:PKD repeat protein
VANFSGSPTSGVKPLTVQFADASTGQITSRSWDFGDGQTSTLASPSHTYVNSGTYTVSLTATGPGGTDTETKTNYITVTEPPPPVANFSGSPTSGVKPLTVQFADASTGQITSRSWNFGDGQTSTLTNPSHTYVNSGTYTVSLTATGPGGTDTETKTNYIAVTEPQPPTITLSPIIFQFNTAPGADPPSQTLRITNSGGGTLNYKLDDDVVWLTPTRIGGVVPSGESQEVNLLIFSSSLAVGTYNAKITVSDPNASNSPQMASVTLIVQLPTEGAKITLTPSTFQILIPPGTNAPSQTLRISNTGDPGSTLEYALDWDGFWLTPTRIRGSIPAGDSQDVTLLIRSSDLAVGNYQGKITVAAYNATNSPQTATVSLTVQTVPAAPALASPSNGAVNQPTVLTLNWNPATSAATYHLQVSTSSIFATTVFDDSTIATTSQQVGPLANNTAYYWRVNAKNTSGTSAWSPVWNFTTSIAAPLAPTLVSPADEAIGISISPTLSWSASDGATSYRLQVSTTTTFATTVVNQSGIAGTSHSVSGLVHNTTYYWRVSATNVGGTSDWSSIWSFTTIVQLPSQVVLISPFHSAVIGTDTARFIWRQSAPAISRYWFELATDSAMANPVIDSTLTADTTKTARQFLNNQTYWWRVRAKNVAGWGPFSEQRKFRSVITTSVHTAEDVPSKFSLSQNYPNPFNPTTTIEYALPQPARVELKLYDVHGHEVQTLVNGRREAGKYTVEFNAATLSSGIYFYQLRAGGFVKIRKLALVK